MAKKTPIAGGGYGAQGGMSPAPGGGGGGKPSKGKPGGKKGGRGR